MADIPLYFRIERISLKNEVVLVKNHENPKSIIDPLDCFTEKPIDPIDCYFTEEKIRGYFGRFGDRPPLVCSKKIGSKSIKNLRIIFPDYIFEKNKNQCWTMRYGKQ